MNRKNMNVLVIIGLMISLGLPMMMGQAKQIPAELDDFLEEYRGTKVKTLIQTSSHDYTALVAEIEALGGTVSRTFDIATGLAAELPTSAIKEIQNGANVVKISKDVLRYRTSTPFDLEKGEFSDVSANDLNLLGGDYEVRGMSQIETKTMLDLIDPATYWNFVSQNAAEAWNAGYMGQDSLAVIIDTGVYADHVMLNFGGEFPVIGGVDLTTDVGTVYEGFDAATNHYHGTHVAGILAGAAVITTEETDLLYQSFNYYTGLSFPNPDNSSLFDIPLLGTAPLAEIFGIKVFDHTGAGVPESEIIASIEYAINMHESGDYDVDVISMSLGGGTGFDGRDLEDQTVDYATSIGITVVTSNGNDGPASMTTGSPGTANTAISVGAAANPVNTRIFWDQNYDWFGIGDYLFVSETPQIYAFSSRGPTADGRVKPTLSATGLFVLSAVTGPDQFGLAWASGTSMSCPAVSGAVAVLNSWGESEGASPYDYKQALTGGADWLPGFDKYDQGAGYLNIGASLEELMNDENLGDVQKPLKKRYWPFSSRPKGINTRINGRGSFDYEVKDLKPGEAIHFYLKADRRTDHINIKISDVDYGVDPYEMNGFELYVSSGVRSSLDSYIDSANVWGDAEVDIYDYNVTYSGVIAGVFTHDSPAPIVPGYMRVVIENDWTSFDVISGNLEITVERDRPFWSHGKKAPRPSFVDWGRIETGDEIGFISMGAVQVVELHWLHNWQRYPTYDLDMVVAWFDADGGLHYEFAAGGSLRSPEGVYLPDSVDTYVLIFGYETYGRTEFWWLFGWDTL